MYCFHTTMVLTQLLKSSIEEGSRVLFPYHYGSHATSSRRPKASIIRSCFHTTMVLTQPLLLQRYYTGFWTVESSKWSALAIAVEFAFWRFVQI